MKHIKIVLLTLASSFLLLGACSTSINSESSIEPIDVEKLESYIFSLNNYTTTIDSEFLFDNDGEDFLTKYIDTTWKYDNKNMYSKGPKKIYQKTSISGTEKNTPMDIDEYCSMLVEEYGDDEENELEIVIDKENDVWSVTMSTKMAPLDLTRERFYKYNEKKELYDLWASDEDGNVEPAGEYPSKYENTAQYLTKELMVKAVKNAVDLESTTVSYTLSKKEMKEYKKRVGEDNTSIPHVIALTINHNKVTGYEIEYNVDYYNEFYIKHGSQENCKEYKEFYRIVDVGSTSIYFPNK